MYEPLEQCKWHLDGKGWMGRCVYPSGAAEAKVILPESMIISAASILITWSITQQFLLDGATHSVVAVIFSYCHLFSTFIFVVVNAIFLQFVF